MGAGPVPLDQKARHGDVGEAVELPAEAFELGVRQIAPGLAQDLAALSERNHITK